ncbi:hypothetical protein C2G38_2211667 [Gigaspora rosea]|uniref:Uncharacterized protein n=1 Tax=Gigaspora rosea TaxID=44941 RepID=A0A397UDU2_9GLOM|nr:hypothetical protein C2G38_2211667 [Gigaspora rosea]
MIYLRLFQFAKLHLFIYRNKYVHFDLVRERYCATDVTTTSIHNDKYPVNFYTSCYLGQSSDKRGEAINTALKKLNDCPFVSKPPSINGLAKDFGLSETTLWRAVSNGGPLKCPDAPNVLTSHEENQLVGYCINMQKLGENSLNASQIWNMDETVFTIVPALEKILAKKGSRQVHKIAHGNSQEHISVAPTILAAGTYIPPLIIYKDVCMIPKVYVI